MVDLDALTERLAAKVQADRLPGGQGDGVDVTQFDPIELGMGVIEEMEHTEDPALAIEIAQDHLSEDAHYYTEAEKMQEGEKAASLVRVASSLGKDLSAGQLRGAVEAILSSPADLTSEDFLKHAFLLDAPSELTVIVDPPAFMERGLEPPEGYDSDDPDPYKGYP